MKLLICLIVSGSIILSQNLAGAVAGEPDAKQLVKEIRVKGSKAVIAELTSDDQWTGFEKVCDRIETGDREWLEIAKLLAPGSDAATAESLILSIARALPKAPFSVLSLIAEEVRNHDDGFTVDNVCISPYIEPEPGDEERHLIATVIALESTDTRNYPLLDSLRLQCLENIRGIISDAKRRGLWKEKE